jgi:hypothetical protein
MSAESDKDDMSWAWPGEITMADNEEIKERTRRIYDVLPQLDDQQCGYRSCAAFARAVAEGKAPCYGCISGGAPVAAKVCAIMGASAPAEAAPELGPGPKSYQPGLTGGRVIGRGKGRSFGRGRGMGQGRGMGRGGGMGRGRRRG